MEYLAEEYDQTFVSSASARGQLYLADAALDKVLIGRAIKTPAGEIDICTLIAVQSATAAEALRDVAEHARSLMRNLVAFDAGNE